VERSWTCVAATVLAEVPTPAGDVLPEVCTPSEQLMLADAFAYLPSDILVKVDRADMAAFLEARASLFHHRVVFVAWQMPLPLKIIPDGTSKCALRQLLDRYVPWHLLDRPKAVFSMPIGQCLRGPLRSWASDLLHPDRLAREGYLRPEPITRFWQQHLIGRYDHTTKL